MKVTFVRRQDLGGNIHSFWFKPDAPVRYTAGQFTQIHLPHDSADQRGEKRWFTLSSSPTESLLAITTKFVKDSPSTYKQQLLDLEPGTRLALDDPMGDFVLPRSTEVPLLFIAGGMGITPMRSMIQWLHDTKQKRTVHLLHSVTTPDQLVFRDLMNAYDMRYTPLVHEPASDWTGERERISPNRILKEASAYDRPLIYLAGPEPMVERFVAELKQAGMPQNRLVTDYFPGYIE